MNTELNICGQCLKPIRSTATWEPRPGARFVEPATAQDVEAIRFWLHGLDDGELLPVRGRDHVRDDATLNPVGLSQWEFGVACKYRRRLFLLWGAVVESYLIDGCDFINLLHFEVISQPLCEPLPSSRMTSIVLSHGFCPEEGPHYLLICTLRIFLRACGYDVITPDFRPSYRFGPARGRSERARMIVESIAEKMGRMLRAPAPDNADHRFVLIGHSQGGAASAQVCASSSLVEAANIRGLILVGSESPIEALPTPQEMYMALTGEYVEEDRHRHPPEVVYSERPVGIDRNQITVIHSARDRVVHSGQMQQVADAWGCRYVELDSPTVPDLRHAPWADDIQHDFLEREMLKIVINEVIRTVETLQ